ncbi:MATE family efflux transporter [candidate division KSB1 bacterium]
MSNSEIPYKNNLLQGNVTKNIIKLALPILTAHVFANAYYIIDMIFVGRLGPTALAAVSYGGMLMSLTWMIIVGVSIATSSMIARSIGSGDSGLVERVIKNSLLLTFAVTVLLIIFGYFGVPYFLKLLGSSGEELRLGTTYARIVFCGAGGLIFMFIINSMFRGSGEVKIPMITLGISSILNIILDPLLIFGLGPFPELGIKGAAIATVIGQGIGSFINIFILIKGYSKVKLPDFNFKPNFHTLKNIISIATPGSLQNLVYSISGLTVMRFVSAYGTEAVAAYGIGLRLDIMMMLPGWALGASVATILGQNLGAGNPKRAERTAWHGSGLYFILLLFICTLLWIDPEKAISIFNNDPKVVSIGSEYIRIMSAGYLFLSISLILTVAMNGAGYTFVPMIIVAVSHLIFRIPAAYILSNPFNIMTGGIWIALSGTFILQGIISVVWFSKGRWKHKKISG